MIYALHVSKQRKMNGDELTHVHGTSSSLPFSKLITDHDVCACVCAGFKKSIPHGLRNQSSRWSTTTQYL